MARNTKPTRLSNPRKVFELAERARLASILLCEELAKHNGQLSAYLPPFGVVGSWALELYLKCLLFDEGTRIADTHDIAKLFYLLSQGAQDDIRRRHAEMMSLPHKRVGNAHLERVTGVAPTFDRDLETTRDAFVRIRYLYETDNLVSNPGDLMESVRGRLVTLHPDWLSDIRDR